MGQQSEGKRRVPITASALAAERERLINEGVAFAERTKRRIDDLTAKRIACELDPGSGSLHELAETGAISADIEIDLSVAEEVAKDLELPTHSPWIAALRRYCNGRLLKSWVPYWGDLSVE
jgi:hypothetical protein